MLVLTGAIGLLREPWLQTSRWLRRQQRWQRGAELLRMRQQAVGRGCDDESVYGESFVIMAMMAMTGADGYCDVLARAYACEGNFINHCRVQQNA